MKYINPNKKFKTKNFPKGYRLKLTIVFAFFCVNLSIAQNVNYSSGGQTGTSGTNWNTSGTNPVNINATGTANINTSVIEGYLNSGKSVILNSTTVGTSINSNINKTAGGNAILTVKDIGNIKVAAYVNIVSSSAALDIILWADADNSQGGTVDDFMFIDAGATFNSNGGKIIMAGGPDNGTNGGTSGDGIPDGFAWNGSNSNTYGAQNYGGLTIGPRGGGGTVISLLSNGGDIILRGATSDNSTYPGVTSQGNLKIVAGAGKITIFGKSSKGHGTEFTYGAVPSIAISSSSTSTPAIDLKGTTTASSVGFWASNNSDGNILIQSTAATGGGVVIEGTSTLNSGLFLGTGNTNINTQVLSQSGNITIRGKGNNNNSISLFGDVFIGNRKNANTVQGITPAVTAADANILIQANDQYQFSNTVGKTTNFNSTGALTMEAYDNGYTGTISWTGNRNFGAQFSSIVMGEASENYSFLLNNTLTATGNITAYVNNFSLADAVGLTSSGAGTISINAKGNIATDGTNRRTISTANGNINFYADADASGNGEINMDYLTFNPGTGNTTVRCETMSFNTSFNATKPYFNGTGSVAIESADASFQDIDNAWFYFDQDANGISGLRIGKATNTGIITMSTANTVAGNISLYGGFVSLTAPLTSSATGDIFIRSNLDVNAGASIDASSSILKTAGTGTLTMQSFDRLNSGTITASGTGVLNVVLWSDYNNSNNGGANLGAVNTNGGDLWLGGSNSNGGTYKWKGLNVGNGPSVGSVNNNFNAVDFYGPVITNGGDVLIWGGNGYGGGISGIGMQVASSINAAAGNVTLIADNIGGNNLTITSTGILTLVPDAGSYPAAITWAGAISGGNFNGSSTYDFLNINNFASLGGLNIGYYNGLTLSGVPVIQANTSNITNSVATSIAGPISFYGNGLVINQNLASTAAGNISLTGNTLSIGASAAISSSGNLIIQPIAAATTIGLAGAAGTLAITASNFSTNFTDGFAEIQIGNSSAGNISLGAATTIKDNVRLTSSGNLLLNEIITLNNNDLRFAGNMVVPATNKFVKTNGSGKLLMNISNSSNKLFPVGTSYYNPVTITNNTGVNDEYYVTVSDGVFTNGSTSGTAVAWSPRINLTWNIGNSVGNTGAGTVNLQYGWNAANNMGTLTSPMLEHHSGTDWFVLPDAPAFDLMARTLTYTGYNGTFSPFAIGEIGTVLPLTWVSFTGKKTKNIVTLNWETSHEINNAYFNIERSADGFTFYKIGRVAALQNPSTLNKYKFTDNQTLTKKYFFRLQQVDADGRIAYSKIINFNDEDKQIFSLVAIPSATQIYLNAPLTQTDKTLLYMYDALGRQLQGQEVHPGQNIISTAALTNNGVYFIKVVKAGKIIYSNQFIK